LSSRIVQQTLEGLAVSAMPRVRTTDGHLLDWDREAIAKQLLKETKLSEQFYKEPGITEEEAEDIAKEVERRVRWMNVRYLSGPLVREIMNVILLERHHTEWRHPEEGHDGSPGFRAESDNSPEFHPDCRCPPLSPTGGAGRKEPVPTPGHRHPAFHGQK